MKFESIYETYWPRIFRLCMGYVNDDEWAKDIAQETFITVWEQLPSFRHEASIGTWIFRIASNKCLRQIERMQKKSRTELPIPPEESPNRNVDEQLEFLYQCIAALPEVDRLIISLELEEVKQADIAGIVGLSEGSVRVRIHRIKETLTKKFKQHEQTNRLL